MTSIILFNTPFNPKPIIFFADSGVIETLFLMLNLLLLNQLSFNFLLILKQSNC